MLDPRLRDNRKLEVIFRTREECRNCGRSYIYRSTYQDAVEWEAQVDEAVKKAKIRQHDKNMQRLYGHSSFEMHRAKWKETIESLRWQYLVAIIIIVGFCIDVLESQFLPESGLLYDLFFILDAVITGFFTFDLAVNLFANSADYFREFYMYFANWFDLIIVAVSILGVYQDATGQGSLPFKMIRLVRVLKVMKQIPWLWKLNRLVTSIGFCLVPMMQAYGILLVVTLVYAVLGVHLFGQQVPEYFADLKTALMTLHQAVTGDSWGSGITRSLFPVQPHSGVAETDASVALFFISYMLIGNVLLLNGERSPMFKLSTPILYDKYYQILVFTMIQAMVYIMVLTLMILG